jgi:hypothetical protein
VFRDAQIADFNAGQFLTRWPLALDIWSSDATLSAKRVRDDAGTGRLVGQDVGSRLSDGGAPIAMLGGAGPDVYFVAHRETQVQESPQGGLDQLISHVTYDLPRHVEHGVVVTQGRSLTGTAGEDRLEARARRILLRGAAGDDLYVIAPKATATLAIGVGDGHDVVQGFGPGNRLALSQGVMERASQWQYMRDPEGVRLQLSPDQSLLFVGLDEATLRPLLPRP